MLSLGRGSSELSFGILGIQHVPIWDDRGSAGLTFALSGSLVRLKDAGNALRSGTRPSHVMRHLIPCCFGYCSVR